MVDSCPSHGSEDEVYEMLMHNFKRHYNTNRAPFGLYFHTIWFKKRINLRAFQVTPPIDKKTQSSSQQFILILSPPGCSDFSRKWSGCRTFGSLIIGKPFNGCRGQLQSTRWVNLNPGNASPRYCSIIVIFFLFSFWLSSLFNFLIF